MLIILIPVIFYTRCSQETPFTALFTSSSPEFSVSPSSGLLPPEGTEGTLITITYKPRSFSRSSSSILKIEVQLNNNNNNNNNDMIILNFYKREQGKYHSYCLIIKTYNNNNK